MTIRIPYRILNARFAAGAVSAGQGAEWSRLTTDGGWCLSLNFSNGWILLKKTQKMSEVRKTDFDHAGHLAPRVAITNSLRWPHTEKLAFQPEPLALSS